MSAPVRPPLDRRIHAVREDLADARLAGQVAAPRFAEPVRRRISVPLAPCRRRPAADAMLETEFLYGEPVDVFDVADGWAWAQSAVDRYVGYVPTDVLAEPEAATHRVPVPLALVFPSPSIKVPPVARLPFGALLAAGAVESHGAERFHPVDGGYMLAQHLAPAEEGDADWVAVAELFVGTPYLWGGKSWLGIDCSGLVQIALQAGRRAAPRDSDMQEAALGRALSRSNALVRGDLVFWKGHVGIMIDGERLLHANGYHHRTAIEPVAATIARLEALGLRATLRRL
jgi:cell wall-associated NlpC family hydrolase